MRIRAPAKLNLFLLVTGRRPDGYHDLETAFQLVDLCDEIELAPREDGAIRREPPPSSPVLQQLKEEQDLTVRAARLLQQEGGSKQGVDLHVHKHIPAGGGLGGGSSDAAAVLLALNDLWQLRWPREQLAELGATLGADVPVFVMGRNAWASGRGDVLTPIDLPQRWYFILHPGVPVPTAEVFADAHLTRDTPARRIPGLPSDGGHNDCEPVVRRRFPVVAAALDWLGERATARLTGTGSCVFASFEEEGEAVALLQTLPKQWQGYVARGLS